MADSGVSRRLAPLVLLALAALVLPGPAAQSNSTELAAAGGGGAGTRRSSCTYTVKVKTSCGGESPRRTADAVGLAFGDAYRNEAHAPRLPNAGGAALGRCAIDTFRVAGPCGYGVCYLYLRRSGRDGWAPEWVQVVQPGPQPVTATFYFGDPLPEGVWYGHNRCPKAAAGGSSTNKPTAAKDNSSSASTRG